MTGHYEISAPSTALAQHAPCERWPYAGVRLTPAVVKHFGLPDNLMMSNGATGEDERFSPITRMTIAGTDQDYRVVNGYLIPYYTPKDVEIERGDMSQRNEELIIDRARAFISNAQQELSVVRTREQILDDLATMDAMPGETHDQWADKAGYSKSIVGAVITRMETLGRIINQRNAQGTLIEYPDIQETSRDQGEKLQALDAEATETMAAIAGDSRLPPEQRSAGIREAMAEYSAKRDALLYIPPERLEELRREFKGYHARLLDEDTLPMLRMILFSDKKVDRDGVLIDLIREIGKPGSIKTDNAENFIRGGIIQKIGWAMESIDQVHGLLREAMTEGATAAFFKRSIEDYIEDHGHKYGVQSAEDVVRLLDELASECRARAGIRGDDSAYTEVFSKKSMLTGFFTGANGLLEHMRRVGNNTGTEVRDLRNLMSTGIRLMERTAYTRTPCNHDAPEIWIPKFGSEELNLGPAFEDTENLTSEQKKMVAEPVPAEKFLIEQFMSPAERAHALAVTRRVLKSSTNLPKADQDESVRSRLKREFCSVGTLAASFARLRENLKDKMPMPSPAGDRVLGLDQQTSSRTGRV